MRPPFQRDTPFYGIQFVRLERGADGVLEARPFPGRPGLMELESCGAYYPLDFDKEAPRVGDLIEVMLRG